MKQQIVRNIRTQQAETTLVTGRAVFFKAVSDELIGDQTIIFPSADASLFWKFFQCLYAVLSPDILSYSESYLIEFLSLHRAF